MTSYINCYIVLIHTLKALCIEWEIKWNQIMFISVQIKPINHEMKINNMWCNKYL